MAVLLLTTDGRCWQAMEIKASKACRGQKAHKERKVRRVHKVHKAHKETQEQMARRSIGAINTSTDWSIFLETESTIMAPHIELMRNLKTRLRTLDLDTGNCWRSRVTLDRRALLDPLATPEPMAHRLCGVASLQSEHITPMTLLSTITQLTSQLLTRTHRLLQTHRGN